MVEYAMYQRLGPRIYKDRVRTVEKQMATECFTVYVCVCMCGLCIVFCFGWCGIWTHSFSLVLRAMAVDHPVQVLPPGRNVSRSILFYLDTLDHTMANKNEE